MAKNRQSTTQPAKQQKKIALRTPLISLCIMVKNEELFLPRCLESARNVADEIIVVDTGSEDRTEEIAASFGAKIYHHPWEHNFSKHRNQSLSYATGEWLLIMDADEELDPATASLIRSIVETAETTVISFNVRSYLENGAYYSEGVSPRLFKNGCGYRYTGYVHNQLVLQDTITPSPVILWHHGYDLSPEKLLAKQERSLELLKKQLVEFPDDLSTRHHLAMTLMGVKRYEEAADEACRTLDMMKTNKIAAAQFSWTYFVAATSLMKCERFDEAEGVCREGLMTFDWSLDIHHSLTQICFVKQDYEGVLTHGRRFLDLRNRLLTDISRFPLCEFQTAHRDWVIQRAMAYAYLHTNDYQSAFDAMDRAIERAPVDKDKNNLAQEFGLNLSRLDHSTDANRYLERLRGKGAAYKSGLRRFAENRAQSGDAEGACLIYEEIESFSPDDPEISFQRGVCRLTQHRYDEARSAFDRALEKQPDYAEAFINRGLAWEGLKKDDKAAGDYKKALSLIPAAAKAHLNLGLILYRRADYTAARPHLEGAVKEYRDNLFLCLALSRACLAVGDIAAMVVPCEAALRALDMPAEGTIQSQGHFAGLYVAIAGRLSRENKHDLADMALEIAVGLGPDDTAKILAIARDAFHRGDYARCTRLIETCLALDPADAALLMKNLISRLQERA